MHLPLWFCHSCPYSQRRNGRDCVFTCHLAYYIACSHVRSMDVYKLMNCAIYQWNILFLITLGKKAKFSEILSVGEDKAETYLDQSDQLSKYFNSLKWGPETNYFAGLCQYTSHKIYNICRLLFPLFSAMKWIDLKKLWKKGETTHTSILSFSFSLTHTHACKHVFAQIHTAIGRGEHTISDSKIYDTQILCWRISREVWKMTRNNKSPGHVTFTLKSALFCSFW